jgi:hypothetical protein
MRRPGVPAQEVSTVETPEEDSTFPLGKALLGGAALAAAGVLASKTKVSAPMINKGLEYANALRQQAMLSGFAPVKSLLGNVGAAGAASLERGSIKPLKELLSMRTLKDVGSAYKANRNVAPVAGGVALPGPLGAPGRFMGAADDATRKALMRAGLSATEAEKAVLQAPLDPKLASALDAPLARYLIPFRRTPFNQFIEGFEASKGAHPAVLGGYMSAGAAHGYSTADERYPVSIPFGVAAAAKYGLPYGVAALGGRILAGRPDAGNIASGLVPASEFGISQSVENPAAPVTLSGNPALRALRTLTGR